MFRRVNVPVLGIVENMSTFVCPQCGTRSDIFGHGGARREAERLGVPFLGEVPLDIVIREKSDSGSPVVATAPDTPQAQYYRDIAIRVRDGLAVSSRPTPKIRNGGSHQKKGSRDIECPPHVASLYLGPSKNSPRAFLCATTMVSNPFMALTGSRIGTWEYAR